MELLSYFFKYKQFLAINWDFSSSLGCYTWKPNFSHCSFFFLIMKTEQQSFPMSFFITWKQFLFVCMDSIIPLSHPGLTPRNFHSHFEILAATDGRLAITGFKKQNTPSNTSHVCLYRYTTMATQWFIIQRATHTEVKISGQPWTIPKFRGSERSWRELEETWMLAVLERSPCTVNNRCFKTDALQQIGQVGSDCGS